MQKRMTLFNNDSACSASPVIQPPFHEQHPWLFRWPPLLFSLFWIQEMALYAPRRTWFTFVPFYLLFLLAYFRVFSAGERHRRVWMGVLFVMGYVYFPFNHHVAGEWVFPVVMSVFFIRKPKLSDALLRFVLVELTAAAAVVLETRLLHAHPAIAQNVIFYMLAIGLSNFAYARHMLASEQLERANQEIEHLAQVAERERIARDLHDLLGHTLTVIALKSDVANRLFTLDPERAHQEIAEVEATARKALAEVREAVSGYRAEGFAAEVVEARRSLASAGVQLTTAVEPVALSEAEANTLCLVLREAVTNVIRHAAATVCVLTLQREGNRVRLTVEDNGIGIGDKHGNGLRGMRERLAGLGGSLACTGAGGGGTLVTVELPLSMRHPSLPSSATGAGELPLPVEESFPANPDLVRA